MNLDALQRIIVESLEDIKAQDINAYDTTDQTSEFDRIIIATGTSTRQTRAAVWRVVQNVKAAGGDVGNIEGADTGEWVLVDLGDIVVHLMVAPVRLYYALETLWGERPINAKPEKPKKKASSTTRKDAPPPKKTSERTQAAAKKISAPKARKVSAAGAKKTVTKKTTAKKLSKVKANAKKTSR